MPKTRAFTSLSAVLLLAACGPSTPTGAPTATTPVAPATTAGTATSATTAPTIAATPAPLPAITGERVSFANGDLTLGGLLWKPAGSGPFRAVLWNHGSEQLPGAPQSNPLVGAALTAQGYVVFMPFRRGQGTSEGTWIVDATNAVPAAEQPTLVARLHATEQLSDQGAGLAYLRTLPFVDTSRIAVAGWSYGGIQTILGAGDPSSHYVAAVAFTPGTQAWDGNTDLQGALLGAGTGATIPFLFIQAQNDFSLVATQELTDAIKAGGGTATRSIYPAFGTTSQDGHEFAVRGSDIWGPEVYAFLAAAFGP